MSQNIRVGILTISDRSFKGERADLSGPALKARVGELGWSVIETNLLPDEQDQIETYLRNHASAGKIDLMLTTGGTGFAPRDVTPEATRAVVERPAPGLAEVIRTEGIKITPHAMLSRAEAGIAKKMLIVNLSGSPKAAVEQLSFIEQVISHAVALLQDDPESETGHQAK